MAKTYGDTRLGNIYKTTDHVQPIGSTLNLGKRFGKGWSISGKN